MGALVRIRMGLTTAFFIFKCRSSDLRRVLWEALYKITKDVVQTEKATSNFLCRFLLNFLNDISGYIDIFETTRTKRCPDSCSKKTHFISFSKIEALCRRIWNCLTSYNCCFNFSMNIKLWPTSTSTLFHFN